MRQRGYIHSDGRYIPLDYLEDAFDSKKGVKCLNIGPRMLDMLHSKFWAKKAKEEKMAASGITHEGTGYINASGSTKTMWVTSGSSSFVGSDSSGAAKTPTQKLSDEVRERLQSANSMRKELKLDER